MGYTVVSIMIAAYAFVLIKAYFFTPKAEGISITYFETLRMNTRILLWTSVAVLVAVLVVHAGIYWGIAGLSHIFGFLSFIKPSSGEDLIEDYMTQVGFISVIILSPYAHYSLSVVKKFKKGLFVYFKEKYKQDFKSLPNKRFHVENFVTVNKDVADRIKTEANRSNIRNTVLTHFDDTFYFDDGRVNFYVTEVVMDLEKEKYKTNSKGKSKWSTDGMDYVFHGIVVILPIAIYGTNEDLKENKPSVYDIKNHKSEILLNNDGDRGSHNFILKIFYKYLTNANKFLVRNSSFKWEELSKRRRDYRKINEKITDLAEKMDVDTIMTDTNYIYLFKEQKDIDLFTFYQGKNTQDSIDTFETDFKFLMKIKEEVYSIFK